MELLHRASACAWGRDERVSRSIVNLTITHSNYLSPFLLHDFLDILLLSKPPLHTSHASTKTHKRTIPPVLVVYPRNPNRPLSQAAKAHGLPYQVIRDQVLPIATRASDKHNAARIRGLGESLCDAGVAPRARESDVHARLLSRRRRLRRRRWWRDAERTRGRYARQVAERGHTPRPAHRRGRTRIRRDAQPRER